MSAADEWPLREVPAGASSDGAGPRLAALIEQAPRFPKLPAADALIHGSETQQRKKQEATQKRQRQDEVQRESRHLGAAAAAVTSGRSSASDLNAVAAAPANSRPHHRVRFRGDATPAQSIDSSQLYDSDDEKAESKMDDDSDLSTRSGGDDEKTTSASAAVTHPNEVGDVRVEEDPLYDPHADDEDEAWMRSQMRRTYTSDSATAGRSGGRQQRKKGPGKMALAAATAASAAADEAAAARAAASPQLCCPACFTPLCFDCQRHSSRSSLFRAMFVTEGVIVDRGRQVRPEPGTEDAEHPDTKYFAVLCKTCKTHVAVMDDEEVFHFFNVLESNT